jgi:hypothetical protein
MTFTEKDRESIERGIDLFNEGRYFDAHERWEGPWLRMPQGREKDFLQGLIMAAGAFHHYSRRECAGAGELLLRSIDFLEKKSDLYPEMETDSLVASLVSLKELFNRCTFSIAVEQLPKIGRWSGREAYRVA